MFVKFGKNTLAIFLFLSLSLNASADATNCYVGVYLQHDQQFVAITKRGDGLRFLKSDGHYGVFNPLETQHACTRDAIFFEGKIWSKKQVVTTNTKFDSTDAVLAGQLIMASDADENTPLVVYAHGSERLGWIESALEPYQLLARGVSVFVYDKRGTGLSTGQYNQNFPSLANDLVAASNEAKRLAKGHYGRFGLIGLSQGGWIAPLASNKVNADFIAIGYGLVADFTEEDADQVQLELEKQGASEQIKKKAKQITDLTARMIKTRYRDGIEELIQLKQQFKNEPWLNQIKGSYTGVLIATDPKELLEKGIPFFDSLNVDWSLDPVEVVKNVKAPQYWSLAELDSEAPVEKTLTRLSRLKTQGSDIRILIFPNSDHGMWIIDENQIVSGYFDSQADFAKGKLQTHYGDSWQPNK